jgi:5-methylthioadenosine/S-adenosylhomocysteine deaminase
MRTRIKAKYVIGFENNDHVIFEDGEVVYENDTILFVGHSYAGEVDETINAGLSIVSPGFIDLNALGDIDHDLVHLEAPPEIQKSLLWSEEYCLRGPHEVMSPEEEAFKSLYAYLHLIRNGITTAMPITSVHYKAWAETYEELAAAVENAGRLGLRIYLGPSYMSGVDVVKQDGTGAVFWDEEKGKAGLRRAVEFIRKFDGVYDGLVRGMLAPERIETQTPEMLIESRRWSDELGCPIRLHAAQGQFEYAEIRQRHKKTPIHYLYDLGFLGPRLSIPHTIYISGYSGIQEYEGDDLALLRETQTTVIHCAVVIARHGAAMESFGRYSRSGVRLAMGTDTFPPDMLQNIRVGSYVARVVDKSTAGNTFADLFRAATIGGARALGREDLGRLAPGAKADLIIIDLSDLHFGALDDPLRTLMISASGVDVKTSVINGRIVMRDRVIEGIDLPAVQRAGQKYYEKMQAGYLERDYRHIPETELFPSAFPIIKKEVT